MYRKATKQLENKLIKQKYSKSKLILQKLDIEFNSSKSAAMRIGNEYGEKRAELQLAGNELKKLGIYVTVFKIFSRTLTSKICIVHLILFF